MSIVVKFDKRQTINHLSSIIASDKRLFNKYIKGYKTVSEAFFTSSNYHERCKIVRKQIQEFTDEKISRIFKKYLIGGALNL